MDMVQQRATSSGPVERGTGRCARESHEVVVIGLTST